MMFKLRSHPDFVPLEHLHDKLSSTFSKRRLNEYIYINLYLCESKHHYFVHEAIIDKAVKERLLDRNTLTFIKKLEKDKAINVDVRSDESLPSSPVLKLLANILWSKFKLKNMFYILKEHRDAVKDIYKYLKEFIPVEDKPSQEQIKTHDLDKYGLKELMAHCLHNIHKFDAESPQMHRLSVYLEKHQYNTKHHINYWIHEKFEEIPKIFVYEMLIDELSHHVAENKHLKCQRKRGNGKTTMRQLLHSLNVELTFSDSLNVFECIKTTVRKCQTDCRKKPYKYEEPIYLETFCRFVM